MIPVFLKVEPDKQLAVYLRDAQTASEKDGEAIVDVSARPLLEQMLPIAEFPIDANLGQVKCRNPLLVPGH